MKIFQNKNLKTPRSTAFGSKLKQAFEKGADAIIDTTITVSKTGKRVVKKTATGAVERSSEGIRKRRQSNCKLKAYRKAGNPKTRKDLKKLERDLRKCE